MHSVIHQDSILKALQNATLDKNSNISIIKFELKNFLSSPEVNACTDVVPVHVEYLCDGKPLEKKLIFKIPFTHPRYEFIRTMGHYDKELDMYENILPRFDQLLGFRLSPEHFLSDDRQVLVLEDLTGSGYQTVQDEYNFEHAALVFKTLAQFHAASYKLYQLDPASLSLASTETIFRTDFFQKMATKQFSLVEGLFRHLNVGQATLEKLLFWKEQLMGANPFLAADETYSMQVLNHGDPKWSNILFKFDKDGPTSVKLIDFQNCRWGSPLYDVMYMSTHTIASSVWQKEFNNLRNIYLEELNLWLMKLGCGRRYEVEDYIRDEKLHKPFRVCQLLWQLYLAAKPLLNYSTFESQNYDDEVIERLCQDKTYKENCLNVVDHYKKNDIL